MKKLVGMLFLCLAMVPATLRAQECMGVLLKAGSGYEMISFDAKGKENGRIVYKIGNVSKEGATTIVQMNMESYDKKGTSNFKSTYDLRCNGSELKVDASAIIGEDQRKSFESFDMKFTSEDIVYPANLSVGQTLPEGSLHGEGAAGPLNIVTDMTIANRKVAGKEKITVPAGTFDAFKVTSDMNIASKTVMKITMDFQTVSYRAPNVLWDVKTETYRKGKLMGTTELSKIY